MGYAYHVIVEVVYFAHDDVIDDAAMLLQGIEAF